MNMGFENMSNTISEKTVDVRDGLSIMDRKILSAMARMLPADGLSRRSSKVTRQIEEDYAIDPDEAYEKIVDFAHEKNSMYLVDGLGNFSFRPAASDYSECKSSPFLQYLFEKGLFIDTGVPVDMPLPYLLIGGTPGYCSIDSKIPVHDIAKVMAAIISLIRNPRLTNTELVQKIGGPMLQIGGTIINTDELPDIYEKGYGEIHYSISRKTLNPYWGWYSIKDICEEFCNWYGHKLTKPEGAKKGYYEITIQYNALLTNGNETRYFSLKEILQEFINQYKKLVLKHYGPIINDYALEKMLLSEVELLGRNYARSEYSKQEDLYQWLMA